MPHCTGVSQVYRSDGEHTGDTQNRKAYILFSSATLRAASIASSVWRAFLYPFLCGAYHVCEIVAAGFVSYARVGNLNPGRNCVR